MSDQQVSAVKPLRISPASNSHDPARSPAALKGATSAFLPRAPSPTVSISSTFTGARLAAFTAGINAQQRVRAVSPHRQDGNKELSPPRGRQIHTRTDLASDAGRTAVSSMGPSRGPRPLLQTRSSSTLAAQHATAHSRSPRRGPSKSPLSSRSAIEQSEENEGHKKKLDALSGAAASMTASLIREQTHAEQSAPLKTRALDFEKIPPLPTPGKSQITNEIVKTKYTSAKDHQVPVVPQDVSSAGDVLTDRRVRAHSATRLQPPRPEIFRGSSTESAVTVTTLSGPNADELGRALKHENRSVPPRSVNTIPISSSRSSPHRRSKHQDDYFNSMKINDLADAMVASSLASSRAASPPKKTPPLIPRRRSKSIPTSHETRFPVVGDRQKRSHKPPRPMKHTLRKRASSDEEVEVAKRGRRHWMRKHPNMHSEGDRKRWRDKVTDTERKRYEGVFAANRGLLIGPGYFEATPLALSDNTALGNNVVNVIARDIWERSRLPREVLKEIYDLVSPEESHALNREQFVVGLWLIDQRLKGRKLPVKVSTSVWSSVRHSQGIKVKRHG